MFHDIFLPIVRDHLRDALTLEKHECHKTLGRQVLQHHGDQFINVYPGSSSDGPSGDQQHGVEQYDGFYIGITLRTGKMPRDRLQNLIFNRLLVLQRKIVTVMRRDRYAIQKAINDKLADPENPTDWKLVEAFRQAGQVAEVVRVGPDHFGVQFEANKQRAASDDERFYGVFMEVEYSRGRFMAHLDSAGTQSGNPIVI